MSTISGYDSSSISTLFSSLSTSSSSSSSSSDLLGISYTDYASIRNGSYKKLLSAYYTQAESEAESSSSTTDSSQTLTSISSAASDVQDSASKLLTKGSKSLFETKTDAAGNSYVDYDEDTVYSAVKDFIDDYNNLIDAATESEDVSLLRKAKNMATYTTSTKQALSEIGITVGSDNKLSIDEDTFKNASKAQVQSVFQSNGGYAYQISAMASGLKIYADDAADTASSSSSSTSSTSSTSSSTSTSKDSTKTLAAIQEAADDADSTLSALRATGSKSLFTTTAGSYDTDDIYEAVKSFIKDYNVLLDKTEDSNTSDITSARSTMTSEVDAYKSTLSKLGITIGSDKSLSIDKTTFMSADMSSVKSLFQGSSSLGALLETQIEKIDSYAELEASKSNTYSSTGTYTSTYTSGDLYSSLV